MEQNEDKSLKAAIAGISAHEDEQDVELQRQKNKLSKLEKQLAELNIDPTAQQETPAVVLPTVAITEAYNRHRSPSGDRRRSHSEGRIRFQQPSQQRQNTDSSYSRDRAQAEIGTIQILMCDSVENRPHHVKIIPVAKRVEHNSHVQITIRIEDDFQITIVSNDQRSTPANYRPNNSNFRSAPYNGARPRTNGGYEQQREVRNRRDVECYACGKRGHYARECRTNPPGAPQQQQ
ncbi:hypothetical protein DAPPUDRAFT_258399 [Daphnia pulex]|uniref:CCHC-type domain-containing protein n=1 Tax=Daphnia pulex TaxID=6669 RepID=E9HFB1_DAPPU|nr:hypothetical protein DAPPUDRAFT_258399 [Daphnia pulex]|eukprot:EFX69579.1 hypothetical protein DAPPUDRAFT_258399 [Daphnia pulex]